ncbi:MAG TPA: hypothetical protein VL899_12390 [Alphaproteobacteria bacterium]|nr:hypothetical protein [Alphaproteobacteria bacterium]
MQNFPTQPASPDIGLGIRNVSRSGNYDRPAREGRSDALFGDPGSSPGDQDPQTGRAKPNSSRPGRSIQYLDDRHFAGPTRTGYGRRHPEYENDEKVEAETRRVNAPDAQG